MQQEEIAKRTHTLNKAICEALGDESQPPWEDAPQWQRDSAIEGVEGILSGRVQSPRDSHNNWTEHKVREGWTFGPVKDPDRKEHPCLVPYEDLPRLQGVAPLLLAVQDGIEPEHVAGMLGAQLGLFVGGSTEWKLRTLMQWGQVARDAECYLHVGRVNTTRRVSHCIAAGAHSFDGTSVSMFVANLPKLDGAARQTDLFATDTPTTEDS